MTTRAIAAAEACRKRSNVGLLEPIRDLVLVAEQWLSAQVYIIDLPAGSVDGACVPVGDTTLIFLATSDLEGRRISPLRQRFTLAHELGHSELGHGTKIDQIVDGDTERAADPEEREADEFASHLLMPTAAIDAWLTQRDLSHIADVDEFAAFAGHFGVSSPAAWRRLNVEGLFASEGTAKYLARAVWEPERLANARRRALGFLDFPDTLQTYADQESYRLPPMLRERVDETLTYELLDIDETREILDGHAPRRGE